MTTNAIPYRAATRSKGPIRCAMDFMTIQLIPHISTVTDISTNAPRSDCCDPKKTPWQKNGMKSGLYPRFMPLRIPAPPGWDSTTSYEVQPEIGRASSRERVCQSVRKSVVAVEIKKKK